jgi:hypothetical protein
MSLGQVTFMLDLVVAGVIALAIPCVIIALALRKSSHG